MMFLRLLRKQKEPSLHSPSVTLHSGHLVSFQVNQQTCKLDLVYFMEGGYCMKRVKVSRACQVVSDARLTRCYHIVI